jgi:non-homologous end joining protein Ku
MLEIAEKIVDQQRAEFDPSPFVDRCEQALRDVIERKKEGQPVTVAAREVAEAAHAIGSGRQPATARFGAGALRARYA